MVQTPQAPMPYFGGKKKAATLVWQRLGNVPNYCEPFFGSGAVLLNRPHPAKVETVNDLDGYVVNLWRSIQHSPEETAAWADYPVTEIDLNVRHRWLKQQRARLLEGLSSDPDWHEPKVAGYWVWGANLWIGNGWCKANAEKVPHLGDAGTGVNKGSLGRLPHLGNAGTGETTLGEQLPKISRASGGLLEFASGSIRDDIEAWFLALSRRLRRVRVICGDWERCVTPSVTEKHGITGIFLDPPYDSPDAENDAYAEEYDPDLAKSVRAWCIENGNNPMLRIALCGYAGDHDELLEHGWTVEGWKAGKGYQKADEDGSHNGQREKIWFSPHCLKPHKQSLFGDL